VSNAARTSPASARNREPILQVLRERLSGPCRVLEIASGAGEHAVWFARALPHVLWRPTDRDPTALSSIAAWREAVDLPNLLEPIAVDAADPANWPQEPVDAVVCINMLHVAPWAAAEGLVAGAGGLLPPGGQLYLYGPFLERGRSTAPSNLAFDADLRVRNPAWGLRDLAAVVELASDAGLVLDARLEMPANNLSLVFAKRSMI